MKLSTLASSALACSIVAITTAASAASGEDTAHAFSVTSPPLAIPLGLDRDGARDWTRLELPGITEVIVRDGATLRVLANALVPATLESQGTSAPVSVALDEATVERVGARTGRLVRAMTISDGRGASITALQITSTLDLTALDAGEPRVTITESTGRFVGPLAGVLTGRTPTRDVLLATPALPLELTASKSQLALARDVGAIVGRLELDGRLSPSALEGDVKTRIALVLFDRDGRRCAELVDAVVPRGDDRDHWRSIGAAARGPELVWSRRGAAWTAQLEVDVDALLASARCAPSRAVLTIGDGASAYVVQASGAIASKRAELAGAVKAPGVHLEP
ncbi:hypothetical protein L6R52_05560 [Myxococcota bacterium]|nr:hypothetical protein [Myxococcota bacterium]